MFTWILILGACIWVALLLLILHDVTKNDNEGSAILIAGNNIVTLVRWAALKTGELFRWAAPRAGAVLRRTVLKAGKVRKAPGLGFSRATVSKPRVSLKAAVETGSSSLKPVRQDARPVIEQMLAAPTPKIEQMPAASPPKIEQTPAASPPKIEQTPAASSPKIEQTPAAAPPKIEQTLAAAPPKIEQTRAAAPPTIVQAPATPPPRKWWSKDTRVSKTAEELELTITEAVQAAPGCEAFVGVIIQRTTPKSRLDANWELRGTKFGRTDRKIAKEALTPIVERMQREFRLPERPTKSPFARHKASADVRPIAARGGSASASVHPPIN
jgi:hypothetical protein